MHLPPWLTFTCASMVIFWGLYRISLALRSDRAQERAPKGLFAMARRTHLLIGLVYVLLGAGLMAIGMGWTPLSDAPKPKAAEPAPPQPEGQLIEIN